jgi:hypothetical protein
MEETNANGGEPTDGKSKREGPADGECYRHTDGTLEVVFAVVDDQVLTVREYADVNHFEAGVSEATHTGVHSGVESLSVPAEFEDGPAKE